MILYHGTSTSNIASILTEGLKPRYTKRGNWFTNVEGLPNYVYLTKFQPDLFGLRGALVNKSRNYSVLEIDLDKCNKDQLRVDENNYGHATFIQRAEHKKRASENKNWMVDSLDKNGCVMYRGEIPVSAISFKSTESIEQSFWYHHKLEEYPIIEDKLYLLDAILELSNLGILEQYTLDSLLVDFNVTNYKKRHSFS